MTDAETQADERSPKARTPWVRRAGDGDPVFEKILTSTIEDYRAIQLPDGHFADASPLFGFLLLAGLFVACYLGFPAWRRSDLIAFAGFALAGIIAGLIAAGLLTFLFRWLGGKILASELREQGILDVTVRMRFDRTGIETEAGGMVVHVPWANLVDIEEDDRRYFFWVSPKQGSSIRKDDFADDEERKAFDKALVGWYGRAPRTPPRMARERSLPPLAASDPTTDKP